ncbi:hypothetical protein B0H63DRAFT_548844 [Podospora didyma]|uniref:Heterokaryon incompatibility domain-containing protein n=1 Tax=Podospora didyma TaxID=330526 RepID=A0AAE0KDL1_9PEZI|nr:hypothetical protein B0H63DRAFT_548844 [Podospora didyma]
MSILKTEAHMSEANMADNPDSEDETYDVAPWAVIPIRKRRRRSPADCWFDEFRETARDDYGLAHKHIFAINPTGTPLLVHMIDTRQRFVGPARHEILHSSIIEDLANNTNSTARLLNKLRPRGNHKEDTGYDPFVPSRIVDIRAPLGLPLDSETIRLVDGADIRGPWAALSYCWGMGARENLRTLTANLAQHRRAIPTTVLPAAVRNAIETAKALGFHYIWIDALCIVQGRRRRLGCRICLHGPHLQAWKGVGTAIAAWDRKQRVVIGLLELTGALYPVRARSMPATATGLGTVGSSLWLEGTALPHDFLVATTGAAAIHHIRFPSDQVIAFAPDLPCLYGDDVVDTYQAWSPALANSLRREEETVVAALREYRAAQTLANPIPGSSGQLPPPPADKRPTLDGLLSNRDSASTIPIDQAVKDTREDHSFPRSLCSSENCACRRGWTSPYTHPLWALKIGTYRMEPGSGRTFLKDYFLVLAKSPFIPNGYVWIGVATTHRWGDEAEYLRFYGQGEDTDIFID